MPNNIIEKFALYRALAAVNLNTRIGNSSAIRIIYRISDQGLYQSWRFVDGNFNFWNTTEIGRLYLLNASVANDLSDVFGQANYASGGGNLSFTPDQPEEIAVESDNRSFIKPQGAPTDLSLVFFYVNGNRITITDSGSTWVLESTLPDASADDVFSYQFATIS